MMRLFLTGINTSLASAQRLEKLAGRFEALFLSLGTAVQEARRRGDTATEAVLVSTCNRVEFIAWGSDRFERRLNGILRSFSIRVQERVQRDGPDVARHLYRVLCGLESLQPGESMVASQVKDAYRRALAAGITGPVCHRLFQRGFLAARRVREAVGQPVSSRERVEHGLRMIERCRSLADCRYALLGEGTLLGKFDQLLPLRGAQRVVRGIRGYHGGRADIEPLERARPLLADCNLVIIDSLSVRADLRLKDIESMRRPGQDLIILDYSHSRGVDPVCRTFEGVLHYGREELEPPPAVRTIPAGPRPEERIEDAVADFRRWYDHRAWNRVLAWLVAGVDEAWKDNVPTGTVDDISIRKFREKCSRNLRLRLKRLLPEDDPRLRQLQKEFDKGDKGSEGDHPLLVDGD